MTHRNKMIAALNLASILGIASLGQVHAETLDSYLSNGIFWSAVGAAGQVDSNAAAIAKTSKATISMAAPGTLVVRYSVTPSAELATTRGLVHLMANIVDPGDGASVDVSLVEVPIENPGESSTSLSARSILRLTSSDSDAAGVTSFATRCVDPPLAGNFSGFDFANNVYYIHAVLSWNDAQPRPPALRAVKLKIGGALCPVSE